MAFGGGGGGACAHFAPTTTTVAAFGPRNDPCYVMALAPSSDGKYLAATLSTHVVKVYQRGEADRAGSVGALLELTGHGAKVTDVTFPLPSEPHLVLSSSEDGTVRLWDCRAAEGSREVQRYTAGFAKSYATAALGGGQDHLVCGGCNEQIVFWDRRMGNGLEVFEDSHSEEVTRLRFQTGSRNRLFTASVDGLACAFDLGGCPADINDEDGLLTVMATETAIVEMGFCSRGSGSGGGGRGGDDDGSAADVLWVLTGNEEVFLYDASADVEKLGDLLAHIPDTRGAATNAAARAGLPKRPVPGSAPDDNELCGLSHRVDYLISCFSGPGGSVGVGPMIAAGTQTGTVGVFPVVPGPDPVNRPTTASLGPPIAVLDGGHKDIVRAMAWCPELAGTGHPAAAHPVTGAEDSRVCVWGEGGGGGSSSTGYTMGEQYGGGGGSGGGHGGYGGAADGGYYGGGGAGGKSGRAGGERRHSPY